ncbi:hypothetical protein [Parasphingopyxis marina]|uniref:Uncharacterized protein n=1 Tax=Parasphingopyxis marina TaxID=2761622 RepID=A0A842HSS6_9SPHN|nr:hypothetical protein [Parasphingopyxis marina]MBC2776072.1 hypothetical protein [Parasphingopyxis marina]
MPDTKNSLDDPDYARFAWARYRRILKWMALAAIAATMVALGWFHFFGAGLSIHIVLATSVGVGGTIFVAGLLMGLAFLSSGTGHDEDVAHFDGRD